MAPVSDSFMCFAGEGQNCSMNPCRNGGTCTRDTESYRCDCRPGFKGQLCELGECHAAARELRSLLQADGMCPAWQHTGPQGHRSPRTLSAPDFSWPRGLPPCPGSTREVCAVPRVEKSSWTLLLPVWTDLGAQVCSPLLTEPSASARWPGKPGSCPPPVVTWEAWGSAYLGRSVLLSPAFQDSRGGTHLRLAMGTGKQDKRWAR